MTTQPADDAQSRQILAQHGLRSTSPRLAVLSLLASLPAPGHLSAPKLHERLLECGDDVDLTTVYRTLATLSDAGIVHPLPIAEQATVYGLAQRPHHHAICRTCGDVIEIPYEDVAVTLNSADGDPAFSLSQSDSLVLSGICPSCRAAATGS